MLRTCLIAALIIAANGLGVCYDSYNSGKMDEHFGIISQRFDAVRTFQTDMGNKNAIKSAAKAGLKIAAGVWLLGDRYEKDMNAVIEGAKSNPGAVSVVFIGNEELHVGWNADMLIAKIKDAKSKLKSAGINVPIGTVQTDGALLSNPQLAEHVDVLGANIHPFFSGASDSVDDPIQDLKRRWTALQNKFPGKVQVTEVGWPTEGGSNAGHVADWNIAQKFYNDVQGWQGSSGAATYYFMFHDNLGKGGFEAHFGVANSEGVWKFGGAPAPGPAPATPTPWTSAPYTPPPYTKPPTTEPPATPPPTNPPTTSPLTTQAPSTTSTPKTDVPTTTPSTTSPPETTEAPTTSTPEPSTTSAPNTTTSVPTTSLPVTTSVPNVTNSSSFDNSTDSISYPSNNSSGINSTHHNSSYSNEDFIVGNAVPTSESGGNSPSSGSSEGVNTPAGGIETSVQSNNGGSGVDAGAISGIAVGAAALVALAVMAVVRHRRSVAIQMEEDRKSELAMLSRRSAIMML